MKKIYPAFLLFLFCCEAENKEAVLPALYEGEPEWILYEGIVELESGEEITIELSLERGSPGLDANYKLNEWSAENNVYMMGRSSQSTYTTLMGPSPDEVIIKLHDSRINQPRFFGHLTPDQAKRMFKEKERTTDLYFKTKGNRLVRIDRNFNEIGSERYSLIRRSKAFTVEGYITFVNDTSEFFEMNTRETWALSDRGMFAKARSKYFSLAKEKFEGIYVRGLGYVVDHQSADGQTIDALVLRNIYEMRPGSKVTQ